jgi:hypothetical protein
MVPIIGPVAAPVAIGLAPILPVFANIHPIFALRFTAILLAFPPGFAAVLVPLTRCFAPVLPMRSTRVGQSGCNAQSSQPLQLRASFSSSFLLSTALADIDETIGPAS